MQKVQDAGKGPCSSSLRFCRWTRAQQITYTVVVSALEVQDAGKALAALNEMQQRGLEPNLITYMAVSSASKEGQEVYRTLQPFVELRQRGLEPNRSPTPQWSVHWGVQDAGVGLAALR